MQNTIHNALPIVAAAYGRKFGVQVQVGGTRALTNGKTIRIPHINDSPVAKTLAWGYLTHEAAHVRYTDFTAFTETARQGALVKHVMNVLEDVRIEAAMIRTYPGTATTLWAVEAFLIREGHTRPVQPTDQPVQIMAGFVYTHCRRRFLRWDGLDAMARQDAQVLRKTFPPTFVHRLLGLLTEVPSLDSTKAAAGLAQRIVALIQDEAQEPPPPSPGPTADPKEDGDQDDDGDDQPAPSQGDDAQAGGALPSEDDSAAGHGSDEDADTGDEEGAGPGAGPSGDGGEDQGEGFDGGQDQRPGTGHHDDEDSGHAEHAGNGAGGEGDDGREALQAVLSAGEGDLPEDPFQAVAEALNRQATGHSTLLLPTLENYDGHVLQGQAALARVRSESAKLTARLQGLVQAHRMTQTRTVRRGRTLSANHLHRAAVGDDRIFARKDRRTAPNTALHLLVDLSGSMQGFEDQIALDAAMALALALEPMRGVSCAVTAFPSRYGSPDQVTRITSHGDRLQARAGAFVQGGRGGTPMTGALWYAAADLLARREERKVIMTLTDGGPDDWNSTKEMVDRAGAAGLEMIGVGIATQVAGLFPVAIRIETIADLKGQLFGIAERLLLV